MVRLEESLLVDPIHAAIYAALHDGRPPYDLYLDQVGGATICIHQLMRMASDDWVDWLTMPVRCGST
jgi:hypothetical protein